MNKFINIVMNLFLNESEKSVVSSYSYKKKILWSIATVIAIIFAVIYYGDRIYKAINKHSNSSTYSTINLDVDIERIKKAVNEARANQNIK